MKKAIRYLMVAVMLMGSPAVAQKVRLCGPYDVMHPLVVDSVDAEQKKFSETDNALSALTERAAHRAGVVDLKGQTFAKGQVAVLETTVRARKVAELKVEMAGTSSKKVYVDGEEMTSTKKVMPGAHTIAVKFVADSSHVTFSAEGGENDICIGDASGKRAFTMADNLQRKIVYDVSLSPSGKWATYGLTYYDEKNEKHYDAYLVETTSGKTRKLSEGDWMPKTDRLFATEKIGDNRRLKIIDPETGEERVVAENMPKGSVTMSPSEDYLIISQEDKGPKKEEDVYEILHPADRQPNWRNRTKLSRLDLATGLLQPLTHTWRDMWLMDISPSGKWLLLMARIDTLGARPTTVSDIYLMNARTLETRKIVERDGFLNSAQFAGSDDRVLLMGSAESLGGIGKRVPEGMIPNMYDIQMFVMEIPNGKVTAVTADFDPNVETVVSKSADGTVYFTAENKDSVSLYKMNGKTLRISQVSVPMENITNIDMAANGSKLIVAGNSVSVPDRVMTMDLKKGKLTTIADPDRERYAEIELSECKSWKFKCKRGYEVTGFYNLPPQMKEGEKVPLIVHYYGGCSPTGRRFGGGSHYPTHYWNALGFAVLIVNPSGASGFGQEWGARHVNTMGEGVAEDIIEATQQFVKDVTEIDGEHVGCVSASYGGFMTQLMLTKTDFFACGISHAGISSHTSYWGEGFWGYSYSEVSAANSYPWNRKDLYVERSPLYNADKIHKPLLFTHGTKDTNVPIGESIQMYTALKLLGVPTGLIQVEGENHGIMDPKKRTLWIDSMMAWFYKWLKEDPSWWESMYEGKKL